MNLPNQLTVLRIILTPLFLYTLFVDHVGIKFLSLLIFIIASLTDLYDGYIAKKYGYVTMWGKFLDPLADKVLVSAALIAFNILGYIQLCVVLVIVIRDFMVTGLRSYALFRNRPVVTQELARTKTFIQMISVYFVYIFLLADYFAEVHQISFGVIRVLKQIGFVDKLMAIVALLTLYTGVQYFILNRIHVLNIFRDITGIFHSNKSESK